LRGEREWRGGGGAVGVSSAFAVKN
jgi:hypothetical protein